MKQLIQPVQDILIAQSQAKNTQLRKGFSPLDKSQSLDLKGIQEVLDGFDNYLKTAARNTADARAASPMPAGIMDKQGAVAASFSGKSMPFTTATGGKTLPPVALPADVAIAAKASSPMNMAEVETSMFTAQDLLSKESPLAGTDSTDPAAMRNSPAAGYITAAQNLVDTLSSSENPMESSLAEPSESMGFGLFESPIYKSLINEKSIEQHDHLNPQAQTESSSLSAQEQTFASLNNSEFKTETVEQDVQSAQINPAAALSSQIEKALANFEVPVSTRPVQETAMITGVPASTPLGQTHSLQGRPDSLIQQQAHREAQQISLDQLVPHVTNRSDLLAKQSLETLSHAPVTEPVEAQLRETSQQNAISGLANQTQANQGNALGSTPLQGTDLEQVISSLSQLAQSLSAQSSSTADGFSTPLVEGSLSRLAEGSVVSLVDVGLLDSGAEFDSDSIISKESLLSSLTAAAKILGSDPLVHQGMRLRMDAPVNQPGWNQEFFMKIHSLAAANEQQASLQLNPSELGSIEINLSTEGDKAKVQFVVQTAGAREALENSLPKLREFFEESGMTLSDAGVEDQADRSDRTDQQQAEAKSQGLGDKQAQSGDSVNSVRGQLDSSIDLYI